MPDRDGYIPGVPCWIDTSQPDPEAAATFYAGLFGWEVENVMPAGAPGEYLIGRIRGGDVAAISSIPEGAPAVATWNTYIWVDSADDAAAKARDAGGQIISEPFDVMDAGRMAVLADPEGAVFCVWQAGRHRGARVVNEHGSLNFNNLNTRDPERAKAFYGAVFGWRTIELDGGFEMWTLPGYAEHLELGDPDLRKRMKEVGAPEGFADVVASIVTLGADAPAHWDVTFAVDDADATAAKAGELGGSVLVAPFDAPWVRTPVIADPAGAVFTASQFVPENSGVGTEAGTGASAA